MCPVLTVIVFALSVVVCKKGFTRADLRIRYHVTEGLLVEIRDRNIPDDVFQECFRIPAEQKVLDLNYDKFLFISSHSGMALNNHHYIYSVEVGNLDFLVDPKLV